MTGEQMRSIRKKLKLNQQQLAQKFGRAPQTICLWETEKLPIKDETAYAMRALEAGLTP